MCPTTNLLPHFTQDDWQNAGLDVQLRPYHVIIRRNDIPRVMQSLSELPGRQLRLKHGVPPLPLMENLEGISDVHSLASGDGSALAGESSTSLFFDGADTSDSETEYEEVSREVWLQALQQMVRSAQLVPVNVRATFIAPPEEPLITPRSRDTESAPSALPMSPSGPRSTNPRIWGAP